MLGSPDECARQILEAIPLVIARYPPRDAEPSGV